MKSINIDGYSIKVLILCLIGWTLANMDQSFFGYAIPSLMTEFEIDLVIIGTILSAAFILASFSVVLAGFLADRYGRRSMFVFCLSVSALLVGLHSYADTIETMAVLRCVAFAISTGLVPITNSFVVESAPTRLRGIYSGILQCGYPLGWFFASLIATPLLTDYGWRAMFLPALAVIPIAFLMGRVLPESVKFSELKDQEDLQPEKLTINARLRILFSNEYRPRAILGFIAFFFFGGAYAGTAFYFPTFFQQVRGYSAEESTLLVGISYGVGVLGYIGASFVGEFVTTRRNTVVIWTWVGSICVAALVWPNHTYYMDLIWFSLMAIFFYGTSAVLTTFIAELFPTHIRATAVGAVSGLGINLGFALFPLVVANLVESLGWKMTFTAAIIPSLFVVGLVTLFQPNLKSGTELN